jgi:N-acetylneuraminic acid mutarotase
VAALRAAPAHAPKATAKAMTRTSRGSRERDVTTAEYPIDPRGWQQAALISSPIAVTLEAVQVRAASWVSSWCWSLSLVLGVGCGQGAGARPDAAPAADTSYDDGWTLAAEVVGGAVQEFGAAAMGGKLYVVGGMRDTGEILDTVLVYDPELDAWDEAPPLPLPTHHPNVAAVGGSLFVVGSLAGLQFSARGEVWRWTPGVGDWVEVSSMPSPRGASAVAEVDGWIYVAGGYDGSRAVATFSAYHPLLDEWNTDLPPLPEPRDHLVGAAVGGVMFAVGGRNTQISNLNGRVDAFSPGSDAWESRAEMITPRAGGAGGVVHGEIIVVGGEGNPAAGTRGVFAEAEAYDPVADSWRSLPAMPTPRHGMQGAGLGDALHVPGGATAQGLRGTTAIHEVLTP